MNSDESTKLLVTRWCSKKLPEYVIVSVHQVLVLKSSMDLTNDGQGNNIKQWKST